MKVLIIQGAGMNMRGKAEVEIFGPLTLDQLNEQIRGFARELGVDVDFFQSNIEGEVCNALYAAHDAGDVGAALINPAGYMRTTGPLPNAIHQVRFPVIEVHVEQPGGARAGVDDLADVQRVGHRVWTQQLQVRAGRRQGADVRVVVHNPPDAATTSLA